MKAQTNEIKIFNGKATTDSAPDRARVEMLNSAESSMPKQVSDETTSKIASGWKNQQANDNPYPQAPLRPLRPQNKFYGVPDSDTAQYADMMFK